MCLVLFVSLQVNAAVISLVPSTNNLDVGDMVTFDLIISQLAPGGTPSLSSFDINVNFSSAVLGIDTTDGDNDGVFDSINLDPSAQLDVLGQNINIFTTEILSAGVLRLFEFSLDLPADLNRLQATTFTLAQFQMNAVHAGISALFLSVNSLSDSNFGALDFTTENTLVTVQGGPNPVPEPSIIWIFSVVLAVGLAKCLRQKNLQVSRK